MNKPYPAIARYASRILELHRDHPNAIIFVVPEPAAGSVRSRMKGAGIDVDRDPVVAMSLDTPLSFLSFLSEEVRAFCASAPVVGQVKVVAAFDETFVRLDLSENDVREWIPGTAV